MLDEYLQDEQAEKKRDYEAWNLNKDVGTRVEAPAREKEVIREVQEEEEEDIDRPTCSTHGRRRRSGTASPSAARTAMC